MAWQDVPKWKRITCWTCGTLTLLVELMLVDVTWGQRLFFAIIYGWPAVAVLVHERSLIIRGPDQWEDHSLPPPAKATVVTEASPPTPVPKTERTAPAPRPRKARPKAEPLPTVAVVTSDDEVRPSPALRGVRLPDACPICNTWPKCTRPGDAHAEDPAA
jgi:hypothetical protein